MRIEDNGFIVFVKKFEENSLLVRILSKENGLISGYVKHTKKDINQYQLGNLVSFVWSAKNNNQLGSLKIELIKSYLSIFITNKFYLDLRKYGTARHAGFGLGFERCVMYLTGMQNIRDVIPFPRTVGNCEL